ncbi:hypothetical protein PYCCODRAFT_853259 [Trametes coccinea BRFM310]|uniref:Uncharacterized protein n=1 Tax=Trametes coccinea (strain BRFM310) TaxID=1353009 RepID=A0A1Y2IDW0_TRAC3|nr:hypothetical protein PYCCODRAFT_853259 [Trametes coccinea BRFM310]
MRVYYMMCEMNRQLRAKSVQTRHTAVVEESEYYNIASRVLTREDEEIWPNLLTGPFHMAACPPSRAATKSGPRPCPCYHHRRVHRRPPPPYCHPAGSSPAPTHCLLCASSAASAQRAARPHCVGRPTRPQDARGIASASAPCPLLVARSSPSRSGSGARREATCQMQDRARAGTTAA